MSAILRKAYIPVVILSVAIQNTLSDPPSFAWIAPPDPNDDGLLVVRTFILTGRT